MVATVRINLNIPDARAEAFLAKVEPAFATAFSNGARREEVGQALQEWIQDDIPSFLAECATSDEVEVDW